LVLDPHFAAARALLAYITVANAPGDGGVHLDEAAALARAAAADDPTLPLPHAVLGSVYSMQGRDSESRLSFLRALELDPNDTTSMANLSVHESEYGRLDESLSWARRLLPLTVNDGGARYHLAVPLIALRDDALTERWLVTAERDFPTHPRIQLQLAAVEWLQGRGPTAVSRLDRALQRWPGNEEIIVMRADLAWLARSADVMRTTEALYRRSPDAGPGYWYVSSTARARYARLLLDQTRAAEAEPLIRIAEEKARSAVGRGSRPFDWIELAGVQALRRDADGAIESLERAYEYGARGYGFLDPDPMFAAVRSDPRFRALMNRMRDDVAAQRQRAAARGLADLDPLARN
jgi:tetratricopeptide (TPR) repeat protein